jgi:hypothetical protein
MIIVSNLSGVLMKVTAQGGEFQVYLNPDSSQVVVPRILPDGETLIARRINSDSSDDLVMIRGTNQTVLIHDEAGDLYDPIYAKSGHLLYTRGLSPADGSYRGLNINLWAVPFDPVEGRITGSEFLVAENTDWPSVSEDGTLVYRNFPIIAGQLVWVDRQGAILDTISRDQLIMTLTQ